LWENKSWDKVLSKRLAESEEYFFLSVLLFNNHFIETLGKSDKKLIVEEN